MSIKIDVNSTTMTIENDTLSFGELISDEDKKREVPFVLAKQDGVYHELTETICESGKIEFVDITEKIGMDTYKRTAQFIFIKATLDIFKNAKISINHSINKGIYGEIHKETPLTKDELIIIKNRMLEIINQDIIIEKKAVKKIIANQIFDIYNMEERKRLLKHVKSDVLKLYKLEDRYDYFYGAMAYSTGVLKTFDIMFYEPGFIIRLPRTKTPSKLPVFKEQKQLHGVFKETAKWLKILGVSDVGALNEKIDNDEIGDIIRVSEALHEKKIAQIADKFCESSGKKIILVAGPSSSGKTTFTKRLAVQLRVNGLKPVMISLDDYFLNRTVTPLDEDGKPDFECLEALDVSLFNQNLNDLLNGKVVQIPSYNFKTGKREWLGNKISLADDEILLIEGIHGLNDKLTSKVDNKYKFKIYISALTQLNLDSHNKISTTDVRKVRRIVRDSLSRGYDAKKTLGMWNSIKKGEEKNIFVYQEETDIMFNSTLVYELCILKNLAINELSKIEKDCDNEIYYEAKRLMALLRFFEDIDFCMVPNNSLLREFIGGSCFYKY
ncbi:MAG: nucleoside kinase [Sarcina sp.]